MTLSTFTSLLESKTLTGSYLMRKNGLRLGIQ